MTHGAHCDYCGQHVKTYREYIELTLCHRCYREVMALVKVYGALHVLGEMAHGAEMAKHVGVSA